MYGLRSGAAAWYTALEAVRGGASGVVSGSALYAVRAAAWYEVRVSVGGAVNYATNKDSWS